MNRVSTNMSRLDAQYHTMMRELKLNDMENKMGTQSRLKDLRDDPFAASHAVRYQSKLLRLERYGRNIEDVKANLSIAEVKVRDAVELVQRARELAVQGANGVYTKDDLKAMATEVDQLLEEIVSLANSQNGQGNMLFAGFESKQEPFRILRGRLEGEAGKITEVQYRGDIGRNLVEVSEEALSEMNIPGNYVFWAENQSVYASLDATNYKVQSDAVIRIDGVDIHLKEGDNIYAIIARINDAPVAVKASLDPVTSGLVLTTTTPHQLWLEDGKGGSVFQDLGVLRQGGGNPPHNYAPSATVFGGSVFDVMLALRDSLAKGDQAGVNRALGGMDQALTGLTSHLAEIGAVAARLDGIAKRQAYELTELTDTMAKEVDLDLTKAITDLKMLEYVHQAALNTAARILRPSLLDFLR